MTATESPADSLKPDPGWLRDLGIVTVISLGVLMFAGYILPRRPAMSRDPYPDVLELSGLPWPKQGEVWVGPAITDPEHEMLATAVPYERSIRHDGRPIMEDAGIPLDRFGWDKDDVTITEPEEGRHDC